jgi:hypothetical protein
VVSFTPRPLYHRGNNPWYPLDRRLGGLQTQSGRNGGVEILAPLRKSNSYPLIIQPIRNSYTNCAIPALPVPTSKTINFYAPYTKSVFPEVTATLDKNMKFYDLVFTDLFIKN